MTDMARLHRIIEAEKAATDFVGGPNSAPAVAERFGLRREEIQKLRTIRRNCIPEIVSLVLHGEMALSTAIKIQQGNTSPEKQAEELAKWQAAPVSKSGNRLVTSQRRHHTYPAKAVVVIDRVVNALMTNAEILETYLEGEWNEDQRKIWLGSLKRTSSILRRLERRWSIKEEKGSGTDNNSSSGTEVPSDNTSGSGTAAV